MAVVHSGSALAPTEPAQAQAVGAFVALVRRARAMGLLDESEMVAGPDRVLVARIAAAAAAEGVGADAAIALQRRPLSPERLADLMTRLGDALEESPLPRHELAALSDVFDVDTLASLVDVSPVSLRRYAAGSRTPPDSTAARIHWLALVAGDLRGAYNAIGVRRWFERPRTALAGSTPGRVLSGAWDPDAADVRAVRALAAALTTPGQAT